MRWHLFVYIFAGFLIAEAQEQPATVKTGVEEVVLDVVVRDKKGRPIKDLSAEEISVSDNGVKQKVKSFRLVDGQEAIERGSRITLDPMRQVRLITLTFEGLSPDGRRLAKQAALDLVKSELAQNVYFAVFSVGNSLFGLQEFTTDREKLKKAIELATSGQFMAYAAENARVRNAVRETMQRASVAPQAAPPPVPSSGQSTQEVGSQMGSQAVERRLAQIMNDMMSFDQAIATTENTRMSIFSLLSLVRGQATLPGRKSILYFSEGMLIPPHLDEPFRSVMSTANRANVTFYPVDTGGVRITSANLEAAKRMKEAAETTADDITRTDGRISKDAILAADTAEQSGRNNQSLPLRALAESTGGFLIGDSNDLRVPLRQVNEEVNSYYEVTYSPGIETYDGSFRKTQVEVDRKDTVVHSRNGYFALPLSSRGPAVLPYEVPLLKALSENPLPKQIEYRSAAVRFQTSESSVKATALVELPMANVEFTEDKSAGTYKARVSVVALLKNQQGEVVQKFSRDLPLSGPVAQIPAVKAGNFIYKEQFEVPPGRYTLETALLDHQSSKLAARKSAFIVPQKGSGVAISSVSLVRNFQPGAKDLQPNDPFQYQGGRITPTLAGTVYAVKGAQVSLFMVVYPDPKIAEKPTLTVEYLTDGKPVGRGEVPLPASDAEGRIPYVMSSPAESIPPGTYQVKAVVKQGNSIAEESTFVTVASRP